MVFGAVSLAILLLLFDSSWNQVDKTMKPRERGHDVVLKVVERIHASGIFKQDNYFVHRIAWFQTSDGEAPGTYTKPNYYGGIWSVDEVNFEKTKDRKLKTFHQAILKVWGINWGDMQWRDLEVPFHCGLAARLYIETLPGDIPPTLAEQADYFMDYYDYDGEKSSAELFINRNEEHENKYKCVAKRDLCFILDSSGSVGQPNHKKALDFIWEIGRSMTLGFKETHISQVTFSTNPELSYADIYDSSIAETLIKGVPFQRGGTYTARALAYAIDEVYLPFYRKNESGILPVFVVLTDGYSWDTVTIEAQIIAELGITTIAVGIGSQVVVSELLEIANNLTENVFEATFEHLNGILKLLEHSTCSTPAPFYYDGNPVRFHLGPTQTTFVKVAVPYEGITVSINRSEGSVTSFISYTETTPNSAVYDAIVTPGHPKFFPHPTGNRTAPPDENITCYVYVGITSGESEQNVFDLIFLSGNRIIPTTAATTSTTTLSTTFSGENTTSTTPTHSTGTAGSATANCEPNSAIGACCLASCFDELFFCALFLTFLLNPGAWELLVMTK